VNVIMSKLLCIYAAIAALTIASSLPLAAVANIEDLPGMDTAATMQEWLKLTDDQVAKLEPVIETRITKVDAALSKVEAAEEPDAIAFIEEYGAAKTEFNTGVTNILTPQQLTQWETFKAELENELVQAGASKQLLAMQPALKLTDEQVAALQPAMAEAVQKKIDVVQKLADSGRISLRDKLQAKRALGDANAGLEKAMGAIMSPDQIAGYKAATAK
jgi:hypothetical protein